MSGTVEQYLDKARHFGERSTEAHKAGYLTEAVKLAELSCRFYDKAALRRTLDSLDKKDNQPWQ